MPHPTYYTDPVPPVVAEDFVQVPAEVVGVARHSETADWWVVYRRLGYYRWEASPWGEPPSPQAPGPPPEPSVAVGSGYYHHHGGGLYVVEGMALLPDSREWVVVYRSVQWGRLNIRPLELFVGEHEGQPRFRYGGKNKP